MREVFAKYANLELVWGKTDCCQFVGECIEAVHGFNPAKFVQYDSEVAAKRLFQTHGGLAGVLDMILSPSMPKNVWYDGDVGLVDNGVSNGVGVYYGDRIVCRTATGIVDLPQERSRRIWRMPRSWRWVN